MIGTVKNGLRRLRAAGRPGGALCAWTTLDARAIGIFRCLLAGLTLVDWFRRFPVRALYYTDRGVLPAASLSLYDWQGWVSVLATVDDQRIVTAAFVVELVALVFVWVGLAPRVAAVVVWAIQLSIISRNPIVLNGADYVLCAWWLWALFLPLDCRFAWGNELWRRLRARASVPSGHSEQARRLVVTPVALVFCWQLAFIYLFNAVHKSGWTWRDGSAVWYLLHQDRQVTDLGVWLREHAPLWSLRAASFGALTIEALAPLLILWPFSLSVTRLLAVVLLTFLHVGIWLTVDLALFSPTFLITFVLLLRPMHFDWLERKARRTVGPAGTASSSRFDAGWLTWASVSVLLAGVVHLVLVENRAVTDLIRVPPPPVPVARTLQALKLQQRWDMFSPIVPPWDGRLVVEVESSDGRFVDIETGGQLPAGPNQPHHYHQDSFWERYTHALSYPSYRPQRAAFRQWLIRVGAERALAGLSPGVTPPEPRPTVRSISAYWLFSHAPPPGAHSGPAQVCFGDMLYWPPREGRRLVERRKRLWPVQRCPWL